MATTAIDRQHSVGPAERELARRCGRRARVREAALAAGVSELEAELRARDDFLAIAAHELRNPMTPIGARLELLLTRARDMSGGVQAGFLHGLELLEGLVNAQLRRATTLLEVARVGSGKLNLQTAEIDLSAVIRQATTNMLPLAESAGRQVPISVEDGVSALCDPMAVEQISENLHVATGGNALYVTLPAENHARMLLHTIRAPRIPSGLGWPAVVSGAV